MVIQKVNRERILLYFLLLTVFALQAQPGKEGWHWQFGDSCYLDFTSGAPVSGVCPVNVVEGTASYSDPLTGQLLFFTDGTSVWDKNNNLMPSGSGLYGGYGTSSNAALIIPKPGSSTIYFIITADQGGYRPQPVKGINYSVLDMSLNGGLGDVIIKNHSLVGPPTSEKLVGVKHCNGSDYWIITHLFESDAFYTFKVTAGGIDTVPVISHSGTVYSDGNSPIDSLGTIGCAKASPNGQKIAVCQEYYQPMLELYDFNNSSGKVSNPVTIQYNGWSSGTYGVAFSPDSKKVYTTIETSCNNQACKPVILQYDLTNFNLSAILASRFRIDTLHDSGALQLGPDGKIYVSVYNVNYLNVINNPNAAGLACNFQVNAVPLSAGSKSKLGLPNFIDTNDSASVVNIQEHIYLCNVPAYTLNASAGSSYLWSNGDTTATSDINNFGTYWVDLVTSDGCKETDTFYVAVKLPPTVSVLYDTSICTNATSFPFVVNATAAGALSYTWSDGFAGSTHTVSSAGMYWVQYTFPDFCYAKDSFSYTLNSLPVVYAGRDTILCGYPNYSITLSANTNAPSYEWSNAQASLQITVNDSGYYWITVYDSVGCINVDTVHVGFIVPPLISVLKDTSQCSDALSSFQVDASYPNTVSYLWNDSLTNPIRNITVPGYYQVEYQLADGCIAYDGFLYSETFNPNVDLGPDTAFCIGNKVLDASNVGVTYLWSNGETSQQILANSPGLYWVVANAFGCLGSDTILISPDLNDLKFTMPNIITPNGDGLNELIDFGIFNFSELELEIFNRWGNKVFKSSDPSCKWAPLMDDGTYYFVMRYTFACGQERQGKTLSGYITLIK